MKPVLLFVLSLLLLGGCLSDAALDYDQIHVSAVRAADGSSASTTPENGCTTLPLLLGSRVERTIRIDGEIGVELEATRESVRVRLRDVTAPDLLTIPAEDLRSASFARDLPVQSTSGQSFIVRLRSRCISPANPTDAGSD
jgi:hypothetical protein